MIRSRSIERVIFQIAFIVILLFICGQCRKRGENAPSIRDILTNIPCWNQSWKGGQWKSVEGNMERGKSICVSTGDPNSDMVYFSTCELCGSMYIRDPAEHKERIILTSRGSKYHCEHKWNAIFRKRSVEEIESGDILLLVYKRAMYCVKIEEILRFVMQGIRYQIAQVVPEDVILNKIDTKKLIWREKKANGSIPISSRSVPLRGEFFKTEKEEKIDSSIHIEYDQYFAGSGGPFTESDEESIHIAIVHKQEITNDNIIDLGKFRFKVWEDGLGNRCDRIDSKEQEYEKEVTY